MPETFDRKKAAEAQSKFAQEHECPMFAPIEGWCYHCGRNIYEQISVEEAGKRLITGCPHCYHSFVD